MLEPISVKVDPEYDVAYVEYCPRRGRVAETRDVAEDVVIDFDRDGNALGIELLGLDADTLGRAREIAATLGLAFPAKVAR